MRTGLFALLLCLAACAASPQHEDTVVAPPIATVAPPAAVASSTEAAPPVAPDRADAAVAASPCRGADVDIAAARESGACFSQNGQDLSGSADAPLEMGFTLPDRVASGAPFEIDVVIHNPASRAQGLRLQSWFRAEVQGPHAKNELASQDSLAFGQSVWLAIDAGGAAHAKVRVLATSQVVFPGECRQGPGGSYRMYASREERTPLKPGKYTLQVTSPFGDGAAKPRVAAPVPLIVE